MTLRTRTKFNIKFRVVGVVLKTEAIESLNILLKPVNMPVF